MKPLLFKAILKSKIWGGAEIGRLKGTAATEGIGESFEISGVPGDETPIASGEYAGKTLAQVIANEGENLLGKRNYAQYGTDFPLLVKFISAAGDLSIQVHPDDEMANTLGHPYGKNEMWYVVKTDEGAKIRAGFSEDFSEERYMQSLEDGSLTDYLNCIDAKPGDCFYIPAGRIHSIGAGNLIAEIQQSSDDTFRVYDFDRIGEDGKKRELHVDLARRALDYKAVAHPMTDYTSQKNIPVVLVDSPFFKTRLCQFDKENTLDYTETDSFIIYVAFEGEATLTDAAGNNVQLRAGECALFPACNTAVTITPLAGTAFSCLETGIY